MVIYHYSVLGIGKNALIDFELRSLLIAEETAESASDVRNPVCLFALQISLTRVPLKLHV